MVKKKRGGGPSFDSGFRPAQDERPPRRRGGGPRTPEGKAVVRRNPIKHAVLAQTPVIPLGEREEDWRRLRDGVFEYFQVEGAMEEALADRIAGIIWRLYRVVRFESESINRYLRDVPKDWRLSERLSRRGRRAEGTAGGGGAGRYLGLTDMAPPGLPGRRTARPSRDALAPPAEG